jgi:photosystem II stability/assembly factor-like uncharacterized protein
MRSKIRTLVYKAAAGFALPHAFSLSALLFAVCFFLFAFSPTAAQQITWQPTNGPYGDVIGAIVINSSSGHIFVGTRGDGVFRSTNNGTSWTPVNIGLTNTNVMSLAINLSGHIFAGTYEGGVFRSTNNGDSWTPVNTGLTNNAFSALVINLSGHIFAGTTTNGVFRSTTNGDSWIAVNIGLTNDDVFALAINSSTGHIFAGTYSGEVFRSTNNGDNWTAVNTGLTNTIVVFALAINSSGHIFAGTAGGVFRSMNNGGSWMPVMTNAPVYTLAINSGGHIFAGTVGRGVFRSTNNGDSWMPVNIGLTISWFHTALAINASGHIFTGTSNGAVFGGTQGGGVFRSTNNGDSWLNTGVTNPSVYALAINSTGFIFAGTSDGVFRSTNNGDSWIPVNTGMTNLSVRSLAINANGHIFAGTDSGGVFRSTNNGDSWTPVNTGLTISLVYALAINSSGHIFAGTLGVFRSTNNGDSWTKVNNGLTNNNVESFAINSSKGHIFAGTRGGGVFRSTNNGDSWTKVNNGLTSTDVFSLAINSSGHIFAGTFDGVLLRSTDNGDSWTPVNSDEIPVLSLVINSSGHIFAGRLVYRILRSRDNGDSWTPVNTGLTSPSGTFYALAINSSGRIFAGAFRGGVYRTTESTELVLSVPDFAAPPHAESERPISVNDASEIAGAEFDLPFDAKRLWVKNVATTSLTEGFALTWDTPGSVLKIRLVRAMPIASGSGALVNVTFKVNPTANFGDSTIIKFAKANLFDDNGRTILSLKDEAVFRVIKPAQRGDVNANGEIDVPDAILCLRIVVGLPLPPDGHITPTPYEFYTADCNGNGAVEVDDALCILQKSLGGAAMPKQVASNNSECKVKVKVDKTNVQAGGLVNVTVAVESEIEPHGGEIVMSYDSTAFSVAEVKAAESATFIVPNIGVPGKIKVALVNLDGIAGPQGELVFVKLKAKRAGVFVAPLVVNTIKLFDAITQPICLITKVTERAATLPTSFGLEQNYPNPFNPETSIAYQLPKDAHVSLQIYNLSGQVVATLVNGKMSAGHHNALWNGRDEAGGQLPSGVYFYRLLVNKGEWAQVKKMTLLK